MKNKMNVELLGNKITLVDTNARREYFESEPIQTIISTEVAEMMEMEHSKLLRKIDGITKDFSEAKIGLANYWIESEYLDAQKKPRKCYEITKKGCEFLAHKTTGTKGNLFTARYMDRFEEMENIIRSYVPQLSEKEKLQLSILNGNDTERMDSLKRYELLLEKEISVPLLETIDNQDVVIDTIIPDDKLYAVGDVGRILRSYTKEMGFQKIFDYLRNNKILISDKGTQKHNSPYYNYTDYFMMKPNKKRNDEDYYKPYFTGKGLKWFLKRLAREGILAKEDIEKVENDIVNNVNKKEN